MPEIPSELHVEILKLVPVHHLFPLRLVCKEWRSIIDGSVSPASLLIREDTRGTGKGKIYSLDSSSFGTQNQNNGIVSLTHIKNVIRSGVPVVTDFPLPTCHGLILIPSKNDKKDQKDWALWSPFNATAFNGSSVHSIPDSKFRMKDVAFFGLGYDASTSDYKVVARINEYGLNSFRTLIYSLKLQTWRMIQDFPPVSKQRIYDGFRRGGVFMEGALHWLADVIGNGNCIVVLDLSSETYRVLPLPSSIPSSKNKYLDVLGRHLFLTYNGRDGKSVWILKDYGGENKWSQFVSFKPGPIGCFLHNYPMRPVVYLKSKEQLIFHYDRNKLIWLDIEKEEIVKKVTVKDFGEHGFSCQQMPARFSWFSGACPAADESMASNRKTVSKRKRADVVEFEISVCKRPKSWTGN